MHDLSVRIVSTLLLSGFLLFVAFFLLEYSVPAESVAASAASRSRRGAGATPRAVSRPKDYGYLAPWLARSNGRSARWKPTPRTATGRSSWGWAIVLTTFLVNLVLLPFRILAARNAKAMKALQPQIDAINARYKRKGLNMDPEHSREDLRGLQTAQDQPAGRLYSGAGTLRRPDRVLLRVDRVSPSSTARTGCGSPIYQSPSNCLCAFCHCS